MHTTEFLRAVFPLAGPDDPRKDDLIRFAVKPQGERFPGTVHWRTRAQLHALDELGISALGFATEGKDVYTTAHGFTHRRIDVTKDDAVALCDVAWVELDDADIPPETFSPPPSIVVNTSPGRYHLYWLLADPLPSFDLETINYRLAYGHHLREDKGGWALTKWLRLPGSTSYKRAEPFRIEVVSADLTRRYTPEDFNDLPEAPAVLSRQGKQPPAPDVTALPDPADIYTRYSLSHELVDLVERPRRDRSAALWRMYQLCYRAGLTEEDAFALIRGTPNDKFHAEWRYNADEDLWKDIYRGYAVAHTPEDAPVLATIKWILKQSGTPAFERNRMIAQEIWNDLGKNGRVFFDPDRGEALYFDGLRVISIDPTNRKWKALLSLRYCITEGESPFRPVNANLYAIASDQGERITPHTMAYWDRERHLLYVFNGGGLIYRLDGETIETVSNGSDGILFRDTGFAEPFTAQGGAESPTLEETIFTLPNYDTLLAKHTPRQAAMLARFWFYSLFFAEQMDARPHLVVTGPTDSGKTMLFQAFAELLSGPGTTVSTLPGDRATYETVVSNARYVFLDNVDSPNKWLADALCETATGIQFTRRVLYTTNDSTTYNVQCHLGMTSRETWYSRPDVANRLVVLHVERRDLKRSPTVLLDRIRNHRNALWAEVLGDLNRIVRVLRTVKPKAHDFRMAAYADFVEAVAPLFGAEHLRLVAVMGANQVQTALDQSVIWSNLDQWLRVSDETGRLVNNGREVNARLLHQALRNIAAQSGDIKLYDRLITSPRSLSHHLRELMPDIKKVLTVETVQRGDSLRYKFTLPEKTEEELEAA